MHDAEAVGGLLCFGDTRLDVRVDAGAPWSGPGCASRARAARPVASQAGDGQRGGSVWNYA
jgi:hypothetical protein